MKNFEILGHPADVKVKAWGKNPRELFKNAAQGMFSILKKEVPNEKEAKRVRRKLEVAIRTPDYDMLLVDFLSELLALADIHNEVYTKIKFLDFSEERLKAEVEGVAIDQFDEEIKAVTYHGLKIEKTKDKYQATILFDI